MISLWAFNSFSGSCTVRDAHILRHPEINPPPDWKEIGRAGKIIRNDLCTVNPATFMALESYT